MDWYVLHCVSGKEKDVRTALKSRGIAVLLPAENRVIRRRGEWITREYLLFPGYAFVKLSYSYPVYYQISKINGVIKILGGGKAPVALTAQEISTITTLTLLGGSPSVVRFDGDRLIPISGTLSLYKSQIKGYSRRHKKASVEVILAGKAHTLNLSFIESTDKKPENKDG